MVAAAEAAAVVVVAEVELGLVLGLAAASKRLRIPPLPARLRRAGASSQWVSPGASGRREVEGALTRFSFLCLAF